MATKVDFNSPYGLKIDQTPVGDNTLSLDHINNRVGIGVGNNLLRASLDLGYTTDALILPNGNNSSERPGTTIAGMFRFNTTDLTFEGYNGSDWVTTTQPSNQNIADSTNTFYLSFLSSAGGALGTIYNDSAKLTYVPSTGLLGTSNLSVTSSASVGGDMTVTGNLSVTGKLTVTQIDQNSVTTLVTQDNFIELGRVNNSVPTSSTTYELGLVFNYFDNQARQSAIFWKDNTGFAFASDAVVPNSTQDSNNPQVTTNTPSPVIVGSVSVGSEFTSENVVIDSNKNIINTNIDCGTF
jgi:hypothetical protein